MTDGPLLPPVKTPRRRRGWRRLAKAAVLIIAVTAIGLFLVTRSFILTPLVVPRIAAKLGAEVSADSVAMTGRHSAVLTNVIVRAPGIGGEAGQILRVEQIEVETDLMGLLLGNAGPVTLTLHDPHLRISEEADNPGRFNFMVLGGADTDDRAPGASTIVIRGGLIEVGVHGDDGYRRSGTLPMSGSLHTNAGENWLNFDFAEDAAHGGELLAEGLRTKGRIDLKTFAIDASVDGVVLDERSKGLAPIAVRSWWEQLGLEGEVADAGVHFEPEGDSVAWITVKDVGITIPLNREGIWKRYSAGEVTEASGMPRMRVDSGRIEMRKDRIVLDKLHGVLTSSGADVQVAPVPYRIEGSIATTEALDWSDREAWVKAVLERGAIDLTFHLDQFRLHEIGFEDTAVELPAAVTEVLAIFRIRACTLYTGVRVLRDEAPAPIDGASPNQSIRTTGWAVISDGVGAYNRFPYPLEAVSGRLSFTDQRLDVEDLHGRGPAGGLVSITGFVAPPTKWPNVELAIRATDIPLDANLRDALSAPYQKVIDALQHAESLAALTQSNALVRDQLALESDARSLADRIDQHGAISDPSENELREQERLRRQLESVERSRTLPEFTLGGRVDLDLQIRREVGRGNPTRTTGDIVVREARLLLDQFPYPFWVQSGSIGLENGRVLVKDLLGTAYGGGQVYVNGEVHTPKDEAGKIHVQPDLTIGVLHDRVNQTLLAAIPLAGDDERTDDSGLATAARLLQVGGFGGFVGYEARITTDADGLVDWNVAAVIENGRATPDERMTQAMRGIGFFWPAGFSLSDVDGSFQISRSAVSLARITGRRGEGVVSATGTIGMDAQTGSDVTVEFADMAIEEYLLNLFPGQNAAAMTEAWNRYRPEGTFDATLRYRVVDTQVQPLALAVRPGRVTMTVGDRRVTALGRESDASLTLGGSRIGFRGLSVELESDGRSDGVVTLNGAYGVSDERPVFDVDGSIVGARFESPWISEIIELLKRQDLSDWYAGLGPTGQFDAAFEFTAQTGSPAVVGSVEVRPSTLAFNLKNTRLDAVLGPASRVVITPETVSFEDVQGDLASGASFRVSGDLAISPLNGEFVVSYRGAGEGGEILAFLPRAVVDGLRSIALTFGDHVFVDEARLVIGRVEVEGESQRGWMTRFEGPIELKNASFDVGLGFSGVHGRLDTFVETHPGVPPRVRLGLAASEMVAKQRRLTDAEGLISLSDDGSTLHVREFHATMYGGAVTASADAELGPGGRFSVFADAASINLRDFTSAADTPESTPSRTVGTMYAHVGLSGIRGEPASRRGRAGIRIVEGEIANNPITLPLLQLSQLMLPLDASLEFADVAAYVEGDRVVVERFFLEGGNLVIEGDGTMTLPDLEVDLRLRSRGRVVGLSNIVGVVSDQLYAIHVTGPLAETRARLVPVPGLTRFFTQMWRDKPTTKPPPTLHGSAGDGINEDQRP